MPVPVEIKAAGVDTVVRLQHLQNGQIFTLHPSYAVSTILFDPELWILSKNNTVQKGTVTAVSQQMKKRFSLYPNPSPASLRIVPARPGAYDWELCDAVGKIMRRGRSDGGETIDISSFSPGIYLFKWMQEGETDALPFVKQ
jgi:hypothetical protein